MMDCILIRHGIAVEPDEWEGTDANRPLTEKGRKRVRQIAAGLATLQCKPTHLFSSPYVRAYDTARLLRARAYSFLKLETKDELAVASKPELVVALLRSLPSKSVVVCVGHEPLLGEVASLLLCGKPLRNFRFKKTGAACIEINGTVASGQGVLRWWFQPALLRLLGRRA